MYQILVDDRCELRTFWVFGREFRIIAATSGTFAVSFRRSLVIFTVLAISFRSSHIIITIFTVSFYIIFSFSYIIFTIFTVSFLNSQIVFSISFTDFSLNVTPPFSFVVFFGGFLTGTSSIVGVAGCFDVVNKGRP